MIALADVVRQYHGELARVFRVDCLAAMNKSALTLPAKVLVKWVAPSNESHTVNSQAPVRRHWSLIGG